MKRNFSEQELIRRGKLAKYKEMGIKPYSKKISFSHNNKSLKAEFNSFSKEKLQEKKFVASIVGRITTIRGPFAIIKDSYGSTQIYIAKKEFPKVAELIDILDLGDIVFVEGTIMKTNTGEITLRARKMQLVSKSLRPLPEQFHGLVDVEERYRRRYVDLIMNDNVKETFWKRTKIISTIRKFFDNLGYMEAETPVLQSVLGGAAARPFTTHHNALDMPFYLRVATELPLKRLIVGGIDKVYEIGRLFRNEGIDTTHNPEFTTIEFYEAHSDLEDMMVRTENLFHFIAQTFGITELEYGGRIIKIGAPFKRINMVESIKKITGVDFSKIISLKEARELAKKHKVQIESYFTIGHIINEFFEVFVEETISDPTFVFGYPIEISPLAAIDNNDPRFTQRAELFIDGREYANMFTELNDPIDQMQRFEAQLAERGAGNEEANEIDLNYIEALEHGMPPTGGCGIGIDRLVMLFTGNTSIREVLLFPHLRNKGDNNA